MTAADQMVQAACHCGTIRFEAMLTDGLNTARRCDCSFCRMRGAVVVSASSVRITSGEDALAEYRFNTGVAEHHFCSVCGIYTHHRRRSNPAEFGVNAACIEGLSPFDFAEVIVSDGVHHPSDLGPGERARLAGVLRYEAFGAS